MSSHNFIDKNVDSLLPVLMGELLAHGDEVGSRNGRVMELTHVGITLTRPWQRELLLPGRKPNLAAQIAETMWVLAGRNDMDFLSTYLPRARDYSDDGEVWRGGYGPRIRSWDTGRRNPGELRVVDQLAFVIDLLRKDSLSRRAVISIYDPVVDTQDGKDIPCNDFIVFTNRNGKLDMAVTIRSNDLMWGWSGINAFEWSALQEIVAQLVGVAQGSLHFNTASLHLYQQHWEKARVLKDEAGVDSAPVMDSPRFYLGSLVHPDDTAHQRMTTFDKLISNWFAIEREIRDGRPSVGEVNSFPEPMMRSWLRVLQWWWSGDLKFLAHPDTQWTRLFFAAQASVQPKRQPVETSDGGTPDDGSPKTPFIDRICDLHDTKHAAYGDSWKKRGEVFSIIPNIARKVDRLATGGETPDENAADTAGDLFVYLAKYRVWIADPGYDGTERVNSTMRVIAGGNPGQLFESPDTLISEIREQFEALLGVVEEKNPRTTVTNQLLRLAYRLAYQLDWAQGNEKRVWKGYEQ